MSSQEYQMSCLFKQKLRTETLLHVRISKYSLHVISYMFSLELFFRLLWKYVFRLSTKSAARFITVPNFGIMLKEKMLFFLNLSGVLHHIYPRMFHLRTFVSIMVEPDLSKPLGNPRPSADFPVSTLYSQTWGQHGLLCRPGVPRL